MENKYIVTQEQIYDWTFELAKLMQDEIEPEERKKISRILYDELRGLAPLAHTVDFSVAENQAHQIISKHLSGEPELTFTEWRNKNRLKLDALGMFD